jgi:hypothetical protein
MIAKWTGRRAPAGVTRRGFLGGAGTIVTLPLLESLLPRAARAQSSAAPVRLLFWYAPCGIVMEEWTPAAPGALTTLPRILAPLWESAGELTVLTDLANDAAIVENMPGHHARGTASYLTCQTISYTADANIQNGISADQVAANHLQGQTAYKSLELGTTAGASVGACDSGYSCAYSNNISWADTDTPNPKLTDPALVFDRLFAGSDPRLTAAEAAKREAWRSSVLDHVLEEAAALRVKLGSSDQLRLDEYMTGVRELETRIQAAPPAEGECAPGVRPPIGLEYPTMVRMMSDLTVLALECDLTRVVTFMLGNAASTNSFDFIGVSGAHHELSHHQDDATKIESLTQINEWEIGELAYLVNRLRQTADLDGSSMLDNSIVFFSSEVSDGNGHFHFDLPVLLAGRGGGVITPGEHRVLPNRTPIANLYLTMLSAVGVPNTTFGLDGTEALDLT